MIRWSDIVGLGAGELYTKKPGTTGEKPEDWYVSGRVVTDFPLWKKTEGTTGTSQSDWYRDVPITYRGRGPQQSEPKTSGDRPIQILSPAADAGVSVGSTLWNLFFGESGVPGVAKTVAPWLVQQARPDSWDLQKANTSQKQAMPVYYGATYSGEVRDPKTGRLVATVQTPVTRDGKTVYITPQTQNFLSSGQWRYGDRRPDGTIVQENESDAAFIARQRSAREGAKATQDNRTSPFTASFYNFSQLPSPPSITAPSRVVSQQEKNVKAQQDKLAAERREAARKAAELLAANAKRAAEAKRKVEEVRKAAQAAEVARLEAEFQKTLQEDDARKAQQVQQAHQVQQATQYKPIHPSYSAGARALIEEDRRNLTLKGYTIPKPTTRQPTWQEALAAAKRQAIPYQTTQDPFSYTPKSYPSTTYTKPTSDPFTYAPKHYPTTVKAAAPVYTKPTYKALVAQPVKTYPQKSAPATPQYDASHFFDTFSEGPAPAPPHSKIDILIRTRQYNQARAEAAKLPPPWNSHFAAVIDAEENNAIHGGLPHQLMGYWQLPNFATLVAKVLDAERQKAAIEAGRLAKQQGHPQAPHYYAPQPIPDAPQLEARFAKPGRRLLQPEAIPDAPQLESRFSQPQMPSIPLGVSYKQPITQAYNYQMPKISAGVSYRPSLSLKGISDDIKDNPWGLVRGLLLAAAAYMVIREA